MHGVSRRLHRQYDDLVDAAIIDQVIQEESGRFDRARVEIFVPLLVERAARDRLAAIAAGPGQRSHDRAAKASIRSSGGPPSHPRVVPQDGGDRRDPRARSPSGHVPA